MDSKKAVAAVKALQKFVKSRESADDKSQLFEDDSGASEILLVVKAKKYFGDQRSLKPHLITVPHSIWTKEPPSVCLFTRDPQRLYKDALQEDGAKVVDRVVGVSKLKGKFKRYEARRQLRSDHDIFVAEEEVIPMLPKLLGKTFYRSQQSIPIGIRVRRDKKVSRDRVARQLEKIRNSTIAIKPASTLLVVRVGPVELSAKQIAANIEAVVEYIGQHLVDGISGIRSLGVKTFDSPTLPVYYADKLYSEEDIGSSDDGEESQAVKRKREMEHLDELLAEVVDEEDIAAYNLESKKKRKQRKARPEEDAETENK